MSAAVGTEAIALPGGWFDAGTTVCVIADCEEGGVIMSGMRAGQEDEEMCAWDEFDWPPTVRDILLARGWLTGN